MRDQNYSYRLLLLFFIQSCKGVVGLFNTPEGVANEFLRNFYQLKFEEIPKIAQHEALLQAALMEGHADAFSVEESQYYRQGTVIVTHIHYLEEEVSAEAHYTVTFQDGKSITNSIILTKKNGQWWVTGFTKSLVYPQLYMYFE